MSRTHFYAALAVGLIPTAASQAQQDLQQIEIIGRQVNLVGNALSASEGRVSHNELAQRPLLRTGDVLETVPGLVATHDPLSTP